HLVAVALHVAGGDQAGEGGFQDLEGYPQVVADIAEPCRPIHLPVAVDAYYAPQPGDVEPAIGPHGDAAQPHSGIAAQHPRDRVLQQTFRSVGGWHPESVAEIDCAVVDIPQRDLAQEQCQDEPDQGDRRRPNEYLGQGFGIRRHDGRGHVMGLAVQRPWRTDRVGGYPAGRQRRTHPAFEEVRKQRTEYRGTERTADRTEERDTGGGDPEIVEVRRVLNDENQHLH